MIKWAIRKAKVKDFESMSIATLDDFSTDTYKRANSMASTSPYQLVTINVTVAIAASV